ncbi:MAG: peptidoglycan DD-metalloendopeptidase family protein [Nitrosomonadales bacterium]|nr:peptidoglycan DD-metalloendopeptidase family protein [Nitrosomonadales bacterium]
MLTQKSLLQERKLKLRWFVAMSSLPLLGVITAFGVMPQTEFISAPVKTVTEAISLPQATPVAANSATFWRNERVQRGDTAAELLRRLNVEDVSANNYLRNDRAAESFRQLATGKTVQAETGADGGLLALRYLNNNGDQVIIEKNGGNFKTSTLPPQLEQRLFLRTGEIKTTLFDATDEAGLPEAAASQLAEVFGGDIDFHRDLRKGDKFSVTYEMTYSNGEPVRVGRIQAAEFVNQGKAYRVVFFQSDSNHGDYYTPDGKSVRKTFLRSPMEFSRVTSGFTSARFHPILQKWRAHKGVDYGAPIGTKVKVTGDGTVAFVGKQGGYGNVIMVEHQGRYTTVYGHLSRFAKGLHKGQHVAQGDIIGYVGMTGWATGPHLHYEFKIDGQQRDPLRVALPNALPISAAQRAAFEETTRSLTERLGLLSNVSVAKLD